MKKTLALFLLLATIASVALFVGGPPVAVRAALTRNVAQSGSNTGDCSVSACQTIGYAIAQAAPGDTIQVGSGTYVEGLTIAKNLQLIATSNAVTIDASGKTNGILVQGAAAAGTSVMGFSVMNATEEGILVKQSSNVSVTNNTIRNNDLGATALKPADECAPSGPIPGDCGEGIHLWSVTNSSVSGNSVHDNVGGILLTDESGPTSGNQITSNVVSQTGDDCGIVLASHVVNIGSPVSPAVGGIHDNLVSGNTVNNSGPDGAGVGLFAAAPGASTYHNTVIGNTLTNNGLPGVAIHSHAPFQNVNNNIVSNNTIAGNGVDDDADSGGPTGVVVFADVAAGASAITSEDISGNKISKESIGIFLKGVAGSFNLGSNSIDAASVTTATNSAAISASASTAPSAPASVTGPAASATTITPPNTGDGGLSRGESEAFAGVFGALVLFASIRLCTGVAR